MLKEQKRLESIVQDKDSALQRQGEELEKLRKANKKLNLSSKAKMVLEDRDMDTPSSEDSSPKSSFSKVPKIEIKSRVLASKLGDASPVSAPIPVPSIPSSSANVVKTGASVSSLIATETEQIRNDLMTIHHSASPPPIQPRVRVPPIGAPAEASAIDASKPPVPSRAAVNNCLLYTSPSPRDRQKSRMPSSA